MADNAINVAVCAGLVHVDLPGRGSLLSAMVSGNDTMTDGNAEPFSRAHIDGPDNCGKGAPSVIRRDGMCWADLVMLKISPMVIVDRSSRHTNTD